jgi:sodium/hydrogen antiporter
MAFSGWVTLCGVLLLSMALSSAYRRNLPISTALIYLGVGLVIGPLGLGWLTISIARAAWLERLAEVAVVISLFFSGLKLSLPYHDRAWRATLLLAGPVMVVTIAALALVAHFALDLDPALALLFGAILAPTDPVLASAVSVNDAADNDRLRFGLSGEAGLNDGMAFPFLFLALEWAAHSGPGMWILGWALQRVVWAVPAGLLVGYAMGRFAGRLAIYLRSRHRDTSAPSDFLALSLMALSYVGAEAIGALGFLAVFAAGLGLRRAERAVVVETPHPDANAGQHPPAEHMVPPAVSAPSLEHPAIAAGVLVGETTSFGDTAERLLEVTLVVILGVCLASHWDERAALLAFSLFFVIRPPAARLLLSRTPLTSPQCWLMGWFGLRGIGSIYYLCYALRQGLGTDRAAELCALVLPVIALSVIVHGASAQPLLARYARSLAPAVDAKPSRRLP